MKPKNCGCETKRQRRAMNYTCARCRRWVCGIDDGGADDHPDVCDSCWVALSKKGGAR